MQRVALDEARRCRLDWLQDVGLSVLRQSAMRELSCSYSRLGKGEALLSVLNE